MKYSFFVFVLIFINSNLFAFNFQNEPRKDSLNITTPDSLINTGVTDSTLTKKDSTFKLVPLFVQNISGNDFKTNSINKNSILKEDYRYTGNLLSTMPFTFLQDLGAVGQPSELMIYGNGFGNISYNIFGNSLNNRLNNSLDIYKLQSEIIDSVEIEKLPRSFMFSNVNNIASVNVYAKNIKSLEPLSRIRFIQSGDEEGIVDGLLSINLKRRLNLFVNFTNQSINSIYGNTDYGKWLVTTRLRYLLNNNINLMLTYNYRNLRNALFGGADYESILTTDPTAVDAVLYNNINAPVNYEVGSDGVSTRYQKINSHTINFKVLSDYFNYWKSDISAYYTYEQTQYRQNEKNSVSDLPVIINNNKYESIGISTTQSFVLDIFNLHGIANYENIKTNADVLSDQKTNNFLSVGGIADFHFFDNSINPSGFVKYLNYDEDSFFGAGGDLSFVFSKKVKLYGGMSYFDKPYSVIEKEFLNSGQAKKQNIFTFEVGANYTDEYFNMSLSYFFIDNKDAPIGVVDDTANTKADNISYFNTIDKQRSGINFNGSFKVWKLLLTANASYYIFNDEIKLNDIPEYTAKAGIYFIDILFDKNLNLKTGMNFTMFGKQNYKVYDFEKSYSSNYILNPTRAYFNDMVPSAYQIDFVLAGTIQEKATIYFTYENILNNTYYIVPYYPMFDSGLRLGVSWEFIN